mmetsp:Transcript_30955/g.50074  ORF Transcript_30955/g.50074 Transcript_30955/m.50074 type:complete len:98 (-) Transcript_30955:705-998(-)
MEAKYAVLAKLPLMVDLPHVKESHDSSASRVASSHHPVYRTSNQGYGAKPIGESANPIHGVKRFSNQFAVSGMYHYTGLKTAVPMSTIHHSYDGVIR